MDGPARIGNQVLTQGALIARLRDIRSGDLNSSLKRPFSVLVIVQIPFLGLVLWSALLRGGLPFWLLGVNIVRRNGARASRWLVAWRAFLVWLPMMILNGIIVAIDLYRPDLGWLASMLHLGMLGLLLVYAAICLALAGLRPTRLASRYTPHARLKS